MSVLLSVNNLSKEFSGQRLFAPVSFSVKDHDRIAILGPNGQGKTTLIKMILGQVEKTTGDIVLPKSVKVGYLSQDVIENPEHTLYEEAMTVFSDLIHEQKKIDSLLEQISEDPDNPKLLQDYSVKETRFEVDGGYDFRYKVAMILNMFSFSAKDYDRKISTFSGGEKTRIAFAKLLLRNPDLLILDEPTNHLDILSIEWLEDYLSAYSGAVLFVSHDITFVRKLANRILDIDNHVFTLYNTDYENFCREKKERYENALEQYKSQEEEKEKLRRFIRFYMPKPRFSSRAQDRVKKLNRLEENSIQDPHHRERKLAMSLSGDVREGKKLFDFEDVSIGYDKPLLSGISFTLFGRDHLAVMGANGIGKSTFGKTLLGELPPLGGKIRRYFPLSMGVLRQDIRSYQSAETLFEHFRNLYPRKSNQEIYDGLGRYDFHYEEANEKRLCDLSGGELMRVELYQLSNESYDLLLLDEPTNHLDMLSISELEETINRYDGTLVIISHDRDFVDKTCDKLLYLSSGKAYYYDGSYSEFRESRLKSLMEEEKEQIARENKKEPKKPVIKKTRRQTRESAEKIMEKIDRLEKRKKEVEDSFYLEENYSDEEKMDALQKEQKELEGKLTELYSELEKAISS